MKKAAIGASIAIVGIFSCLALAALDRLFLTYGPDIRESLLWMCDPRTVIGMAGGLLVALAITICLRAIEEDV